MSETDADQSKQTVQVNDELYIAVDELKVIASERIEAVLAKRPSTPTGDAVRDWGLLVAVPAEKCAYWLADDTDQNVWHAEQRRDLKPDDWTSVNEATRQAITKMFFAKVEDQLTHLESYLNAPSRDGRKRLHKRATAYKDRLTRWLMDQQHNSFEEAASNYVQSVERLCASSNTPPTQQVHRKLLRQSGNAELRTIMLATQQLAPYLSRSTSDGLLEQYLKRHAELLSNLFQASAEPDELPKSLEISALERQSPPPSNDKPQSEEKQVLQSKQTLQPDDLTVQKRPAEPVDPPAVVDTAPKSAQDTFSGIDIVTPSPAKRSRREAPTNNSLQPGADAADTEEGPQES